MTNPTVPTAAQALAAAWKYATDERLDESALRRAEVLLGIATEIRQEQQFRSVDERRFRFDRRQAADKLAAAGVPAPESYGAAERTRIMLAEAPIDASKWAASLAATDTQVVNDDAGKTQTIPVVWTIGDKAQCQHCHTPIELYEPAVWRHRYTGQAVCVDPSLATGRDTAIAHTFAEPDPRG
jgi:hypothetical protein